MELTKRLPRKIGYARVSTDDQDCANQRTELEANGCDVVYSDMISGTKRARPSLRAAMAVLRPGDTLMVVRLDRLGRSMMTTKLIIDEIERAGAALASLHDKFDMSTSSGRFMRDIIVRIAEYERDLIVDRTKAGLDEARKRGWIPGNPAVRRKDPVVMSKIAASRSVTLDERARLEAADWIGIVRARRPAMSWIDVHRIIQNRHYTAKRPLHLAKMMRIVKRLVSLGDLPRKAMDRRQVQQNETAAIIAKNIRIENPDISLRKLGEELTLRGHSPLRARQWSPETVRRLLMEM